MEADEPWQALACCMEVARAVRAPDPAAYVSHFPVHQVSQGTLVWSILPLRAPARGVSLGLRRRGMARVSGTWPSHSAQAGAPTASSLCRHAAPPSVPRFRFVGGPGSSL